MGFFDKFKKKTEIKQEQITATTDGFKMKIEDIFLIKGRGVVLTGKVAQGVVRLGDSVSINNNEYKVIGIEMFRELLDSAERGDNIGLLIRADNPSLFHKDDLISASNVTEIKQEQSPMTDSNTEKTNTSSLSMIWLLEIYKQFKDSANIDKVYGDKIPALITKYKSLYNEKAPKEDVHKAFIDLMKEVVRTLYIVPVHYEDANEFPNDTVIHCTPKAANKFNIESIIYRCQNMTIEQMSKLYWGIDVNTKVLSVDLDWWDISRISGSKGFCFEDRRIPGTMYPQTANDGNHNLFLCFTGIDQYLKVFGEDKQMHVALFTINDIVEYISASENFSGIIINPDTETHCFIGKEAF